MQFTAHSLLAPYRERVEQALKKKIAGFGDKHLLEEACCYALLGGGKRFRPAITLMVAEALGNEVDVMEAALASEIFHCASLVADDLPCMDDDRERRGKPTLHKKYGEAMALLVTYALIAAGYECITLNVKRMKETSYHGRADRVGILSLDNATRNTGLNGATGGQYLDLFPPDLEETTVRRIIQQKTGTLFEIAFVNGWLFGGGDLDRLDLVKQAAAHFGMAFQIADDLGDREQDLRNGRQINMANIMGGDEAQKMLEKESTSYLNTLKALRIDSEPLRGLTSFWSATA